MDQSEGIGTKIYNASPQVDPFPNPSSSQAAPPGGPPANGGRRGRMVANGLQRTVSKTSSLANFLPTGTLLTFETILPSVYGKGECSYVTIRMIHILLGLCTLSCFFFHFTDSFRGADAKVYYGFVTTKGLAVFKHDLGVEVPKDERYKISLTDFLHAFLSALVFLVIAFSDTRVTNCLVPRYAKEMDEVMRSFPLMVGIICSGLFLVFPKNRYGMGCVAA